MKNNPKLLHTYLKSNSNKFLCDGCLVSNTGLPRPQANIIARMLALFPKEFVRRNTVCSQCGRDQEATKQSGWWLPFQMEALPTYESLEN